MKNSDVIKQAADYIRSKVDAKEIYDHRFSIAGRQCGGKYTEAAYLLREFEVYYPNAYESERQQIEEKANAVLLGKYDQVLTVELEQNDSRV
jgi:hypothetical protein